MPLDAPPDHVRVHNAVVRAKHQLRLGAPGVPLERACPCPARLSVLDALHADVRQREQPGSDGALGDDRMRREERFVALDRTHRHAVGGRCAA